MNEIQTIRKEIEARLVAMRGRLARAMLVELPSLDAWDRARVIARNLDGDFGSEEGRLSAMRLLLDVVPEAEQRERAFWATPLGRRIAWWTGGGSVARRRMVAEEAFGVSRQRVSKMISVGLLRLEDDDVTAESLAAYLQQRFPSRVWEVSS